MYQYDEFKNIISLIPSLNLPPKNVYEIENGLYIVSVKSKYLTEYS